MDIDVHTLLLGMRFCIKRGGHGGHQGVGVIIVMSTMKDTMRVVAHAVRAASFFMVMVVRWWLVKGTWWMQFQAILQKKLLIKRSMASWWLNDAEEVGLGVASRPDKYERGMLPIPPLTWYTFHHVRRIKNRGTLKKQNTITVKNYHFDLPANDEQMQKFAHLLVYFVPYKNECF